MENWLNAVDTRLISTFKAQIFTFFMHLNIQQLFTIANKPSRKVIGLMSGTSLDGLDIALCEIAGSGIKTKLTLLHETTVSYDQEVRDNILSVFSKQMVSLERLCLLHPWLGRLHAKMILVALEKWGISPTEIDLIASHGQTIYHAPKTLHPDDTFGSATLQIGEADHIAVETGIITISDFRQKHIAAGGEGAPLSVYGDYILFAHATENRILLNIGGIANFTYLPAGVQLEKVLSSDTGPGNTIMDAFMRFHFNESFDKDAQFAKRGKVNEGLLKALCSHSFFKIPFPKTVGPELFNLEYLKQAQLNSDTLTIALEDVLSTLNLFTAVTIADAIKKVVESEKDFKQGIEVYLSGGGLYNPLVKEHLKQLLPEIQLFTLSDLGINPDAKEAILFALLANETVAGTSLQIGVNATNKAITMGKISFPT